MVEYQFNLAITDRLQPVQPGVIGLSIGLIPKNRVAEARQTHLAGTRVINLQLPLVTRGAGVGEMQLATVVALPPHHTSVETHPIDHNQAG